MRRRLPPFLPQSRSPEADVPTSVHFPPIHHFDWFRMHSAVGPAGVPVADRMAARVLSLPLHPGMTRFDAARVVEALRTALA